MVSHWQRGKTHRVQVSPGHGIMELSCSGESVVVRGRLTRHGLKVSVLSLRKLTMAYDVVPARCHRVVAPVRCLAGALRAPARHLTGLRVIVVRHV